MRSHFILSLSVFALLVLTFGQVPAFASPTYVCPSGIGASLTTVTGSKCYALFTSTATWSTAKSACATLGGTLGTIRNATENTAMHAILSSTEPWIGAADDTSLIAGSSEGEHFWDGSTRHFWTGGQGGSAVDGAYANWNVGTSEPNNSGNEDCVQMYANGQWNDFDCEDPKAYICEFYASESSDTTSTTATVSNGGVRSSTLQQRIQQSLKRTTVTGSPVSSLQSSTMHASAGGSSLRDRTCSRVHKMSSGPAMLTRVNDRIMKRFGFTCGL